MKKMELTKDKLALEIKVWEETILKIKDAIKVSEENVLINQICVDAFKEELKKCTSTS